MALSRTLGDLLSEVDLVRQGAEPGPVLVALTQASEADKRDWYDLSPEVRPLDPEATPAAELAKLEQKTVFIDVDPALAADREYLVIRNEAGVAHVARLSAGSHPATILTPPAGSWIVEITNEGGSDPIRLSDVPDGLWDGGDYLVLTVGSGGAVKGESTLSTSLRPVSVSEFQIQIENAAAKGD